MLWTRFGLTACGKERLFVARAREVCAHWEPVMKLGEEHCRDMTNGVRADPLRPGVGVMRKLWGHEHTACMCGAMWTGDGYARMAGNKLLEHLICTRCGYRWVTDHRSIKAGFAVPE